MTTEDRIRRILVDELGVDETEVTLNANLEFDLGADSLDLAEIVFALEEEFDIDIPGDEIDKITTVRRAVELAERLIVKV